MTGIDWSLVRLRPEDFSDPDYPESWKYMDPETILELNGIEEKTGLRVVTHNRYGIRGCVCMKREGHSDISLHYFDNPEGCSAVDFHFEAEVDSRLLIRTVLRSGFNGVGYYYDWHWEGKLLPVGFHVDRRRRPQVWRREKGEYFYLLK